MKAKKITEDVGYISGDYECFCMSKIPFEEWIKSCDDSVLSYPNDWVPKGFEDKKIRWKITVEMETVKKEGDD